MISYFQIKEVVYRLRSSIPYIPIITVIGLTIGVIEYLEHPLAVKQLIPSHGYIYDLIILLFIAAILLYDQWKIEYKRKTYDPTLIWKFQEKFFDNKDMVKKRADIAKTLLDHIEDQSYIEDIDKNKTDLEIIDDVLDYFEDVGMYQQNYQVSTELVYHYFYHWIRGYWHATQPYLKAWQKKETARWDHIEKLFETARDKEMKRCKRTKTQETLNKKEIKIFLEEEISNFIEG